MTQLTRAPAAREPTPAEVGVLATPKACGECSLCCKVLAIEELQKQGGLLCQHVRSGKGCGIYAERPQVCRVYQCSWSWAGPLDERWRPDRAGFLLHPGLEASHVDIVVDPERPDAWRREPYYSQIKQWSDRRNPAITRVLVTMPGHIIVVFPECEIDIGPPGKPIIYSGYAMKDGRMQPYAYFGDR